MNTQVFQPRPPKRRRSFDALRPVVMAVALLVVLVLAALVAMWLTSPGGSDGHTLTVDQPTGGTVTGNGVECGTDGTSCSTSVRDGHDVQLHAEADDGYMFTGFTGDCRSSTTGRLLMKKDARCGARFERTSPAGSTTSSGLPASDRRWPLTLTPPANGTIVTLAGHECGPTKQRCTVEVSENELVSLEVMTDPGYRVQSYTGDCVDGTANMTRARNCGVVLVKGDGPGPAPTRNDPPPSLPGKGTPSQNTGSGTRKGGAGSDASPPAVAGPVSPSGPTTTPPGPSLPPVAPPAGPTDNTPDAPPVTRPGGDVEAAKKMAKTDIERVLRAYRGAYERMDVTGMKRLQPGLDVASHQLRFGDLKWVKYTFGGDPEIEDLDVERGEARAVVDLKTENEQKSGKIQKPVEGKVTYLLRRIRVTPDWEIVHVKYDMKK